MPPSFKATERRKPKESDEKEKLKTLDEKVKDIVEKHRRRQKQEKRVDSWGQPLHTLDEGKVRRDLRKAMWEADGNPPSVEKGKGVLGKLADATGRGAAKEPDSEPKKDSKEPHEKKDSGKKKEPREPKEKKDGDKKESREPKEKKGDHEPKEPSDRSRREKDQTPRESKHQPKEANVPKRRSDADRESERKAKEIAERSHEKKETKPTESSRDAQPLEKKQIGSEMNMRFPEVRGETIHDKERLHELVNGEYSGLKKMKDFSKKLREAEAHLDYINKYGNLERLPYGEVPKIARELNVDSETIRKWMVDGTTPKLYDYMNRAVTKSEAREILVRIESINNGVNDLAEVQKRLDIYYFGEDERKAKSYRTDIEKTMKYYDFLKEFKDGGLKNDIARRVGLSPSGGRDYLDGRKPWLVRLASQIPSETPEAGKVWFPLETTGWGTREKFVQIPREVNNFEDIKSTLSQFSSLENSRMEKWKKRFGEVSREEAFMYSLGMLVSDSGIQDATKTTQAFLLPLSKKYDWSEAVGEGTSYYLGKIGIDVRKKADQKASSDTYRGKTIRREAKHVWRSDSNTIVRWMWKSALGYSDDLPKSQQRFSADWILKASEKHRLS
ncbi:MAG: hypothetical protein P1Q69_18980, partial [Candidatus Thorarchaeota archaeon]|nr:hypothetical protein [Candidatus Thorarchaeota archaeon]